MDWKLRKATWEDEKSIEDLFVEMLQTIYQVEEVDGYPQGKIGRFLDDRDEWICVAEAEGNVVAFLSIEVHHDEEHFIYLDDLSVTRDYRNIGIGTALLKTAEKYAHGINIKKIFFHVEKSNEGAFKLYQRLGYKIGADEGGRYRMVKEIKC